MDGAVQWEWLPRPVRLVPAAVLVLVSFAPPVAAAGLSTWKFDVVRLKGGGVFTGMIIDEDEDRIRFQVVKQDPGKNTLPRLTITIIRQDEVATLKKLDNQERETLRKRLESLGQGEKARLEGVELKQGEWVNKGQKAFCFTSTHFVLVSNANEEIVRRSVVRLEDIFAAYTDFLPPRIKNGTPTKIILVGSMEEYAELNRGQGRNILNPAYYNQNRNEIVCGTNLRERGEELARVKKLHEAKLEDLQKKEAELRKQFAPQPVPLPLLRPIKKNRQDIEDANKHYQAAFEKETEAFYQTLYHESFHAYLANFVYPPNQADVPRWLNEGLAQIFGSAIVEGGILRIGHADEYRLNAIQAALKKKDNKLLVPISDLLLTKPKHFIIGLAADKEVSDRHYLNSWALAYYLTFERRLLGTPALDRYTQALKRGVPEMVAFRDLVGNKKSMEQFEKEYRDYLSRLLPDGNLRKKLK